tara:strand:- start:319 stop:1161 length:843 start_codon:yes stop_codon:yes gene_type:complete
MIDEERRRSLSFKQAEGLKSLPTQLALKSIPIGFRSRVHFLFHEFLTSNANGYDLYGKALALMRLNHVERDEKLISNYSSYQSYNIEYIDNIFTSGDYSEVLDFIQFALRTNLLDDMYAEAIVYAFSDFNLAYSVVENPYTIIPISAKEDAKAAQKGLNELNKAGLSGARVHFEKSAKALSGGDFKSAVRESIHAVESTAKVISGNNKATLGDALKVLEKDHSLHPALRNSMSALYGWTSDEGGIRHAQIDDSGHIDASLAIYMYQVCIAFASYLARAST